MMRLRSGSNRDLHSSPLTLRDLAKASGTSAMPVRDALMRLVAERAVVMPNARSFAMPLMSHDEFKQLCQFRILVDAGRFTFYVHITARVFILP